MEDLIKAAEALLTYIEEEDVCDTSDDDGDGLDYHSRSHEFRALTEDLKAAIKEAIPTRDAMKLIKKCFITSVQTAVTELSGRTQPLKLR